MLLFIILNAITVNLPAYFNTSHVTVYRFTQPVIIDKNKFQYISCYCLSLRPPNIPYTLNISIHLMLLFIGNAFILSRIWLNFNTSHVTVYRSGYRLLWFCLVISIHLMLLFILNVEIRVAFCACISIHLMLLFIQFSKNPVILLARFQYISCYCLSV